MAAERNPSGKAKDHPATRGAALTANRPPDALGGTFELSLQGEVDLSQRAALRELAVAYVSDGSRHAKVDLSAVSFMDSSGLGFLVRLLRISRSRRGLVTLTRPQATVLRLLRTTHLDQLFEIEV